MSTIVYSANIGQYDIPKDPIYKDRDFRYILFTDDIKRKSKYWEIINIDPFGDHRSLARYLKLQPHIVLPEHENSIWVDSSFHQKSTIKKLVTDCTGVSSYSHKILGSDKKRDCIYDEATVCIEHELDDISTIYRQMDKYSERGFPSNHGLFATGILVRKNTNEINEFNNLWWNEVKTGSKRDQLSQVYCSWKLGVSINVIPGDIYNSRYFTKSRHLKKR